MSGETTTLKHEWKNHNIKKRTPNEIRHKTSHLRKTPKNNGHSELCKKTKNSLPNLTDIQLLSLQLNFTFGILNVLSPTNKIS